MFVFMIAVASTITPPVAIAAYAAASISGGKPIGTAVEASRIGIMIFIIPFAFAYNPLILTVPQAGGVFTWGAYLLLLVKLVVAIYVLASALIRFDKRLLGWLESIARVAASVLLFAPGGHTDLCGCSPHRSRCWVGTTGRAAPPWPPPTPDAHPICRKSCIMRTNFIFIVADDLGYADLGCYGGRAPVSPNLDALAANGARFVNGYSNSPVCSPTRFALMTGRYQYWVRGASEEPMSGNARAQSRTGAVPAPAHPAFAVEGEGLPHGADRQMAPGLPPAFWSGEERLHAPLRPHVGRRELLRTQRAGRRLRHGARWRAL